VGKMKKQEIVYAFIDSQNLNLGILDSTRGGQARLEVGFCKVQSVTKR